MILRSLDVCDLLRVQQVAHSWFAAIQNSQKLQRKLCLLPEEHCNFYMLFESYRNRLPGLHSARPRCSLPPHQADSGNHLDFYIDISPPFVKKLGYRPSSDPKPIEVGSRCRQMLICQPPLRTMGVFPDCCRSTGIFSFDRHKSSQLPIETITAKDGVGITIGEVIEVYERISARHKLCPDASIVDHDELGFVRSRVTLYAKLELDDQDPTLLKYKNETERRARSKLEGDALDTRMQPYIAAKRTGEFVPVMFVRRIRPY